MAAHSSCVGFVADQFNRNVGAGGIHPSRLARPWIATACAFVLLSGCGGRAESSIRSVEASTARDDSSSVVSPAAVAPVTTISLSPLAAAIVPAGSALYDPRAHTSGAAPVSITLGGAGIRDAPIVAVGVDSRGAFDVPGVREVGWYRFGPRPGDAGSAVLAAHIAFNGVDGVFRRLASVLVGTSVTVGSADGSTRAFIVAAVERIDKDELPAELFATSGPSRLVLITCGGAFNRERSSYEDNIVVTAVPVTTGTQVR